MRLRSNAPLTSGSIDHRTQIATYSDGRSVGYDPRTETGFDVAGIAVTVNDLIAYDRIGSLCWDTASWREWMYTEVGLTVSDDEPLLLAPPSPVTSELRTPRAQRVAAYRTGGAVVLAVICIAALVLGASATSPPPSGGTESVDSMSTAAQPAGVVQRGSTSAVPAYVIVSAGVQPQLGLVGDVVISPPDAEVSTAQHKRICAEIAKREGFVVVRLFRTADAYVAVRDATFRAENPGAIRHGFLGILMKDGSYRTAEELDWNTAIPAQ